MINFPDTPAINETFTVGDITWVWVGNRWIADTSSVTGLEAIPDDTLLSNVSGVSDIPIGNTLTATLDSMVGNTRGTVMYRGASAWSALNPGTAGQYLQTGGSAADPIWATVSTGSGLTSIPNNTLLSNVFGASAVPVGNTLSATLDSMLGNTRGAVMYRGASGWVTLGPGTAGNYLRTGGSGADPAWATIISALSGLSDVTLTGVVDYDQLVQVGGVWTNQRPRYVIGAYVPGPMLANQNLLFHRFSKGVTIPANGGAYLGHASEAAGSVNATASTVITWAKAPSATPTVFTNCGTITIAAGVVVGTFGTTGSAPVAFAQGDIVRFRGPASADATFADFFMSLVGYET